MKLMRVLSFLLLGMLAACDGKLGMNGLTTRQYAAPLTMTTVDLDARFMFVRTPDAANAECTARGMRQPPSGGYTTGCAIQPNSKFNPIPRFLIIAVHPIDWNDTQSLANLGHEVAHGLGASHE